MVENRIRKLQNEEKLLLKQIDLAHKNTLIAEEVKKRRQIEDAVWRKHLAKLDRAKLRQQKLNSQSREQNKVKKERARKELVN